MVSRGIDYDNSVMAFNVPVLIQNLASTKSDIVIFSRCVASGYLVYMGVPTQKVTHDFDNQKTIYNSTGSLKGMVDLIADCVSGVAKYADSRNEMTNYKNLGLVTIPRGYSVKRNGAGVGLMTSADAASLFFGVAMQEIAVNSYGDIKYKGYLLRPYLDGLAAVTVAENDSVSVTATGNFEKSSAHTVMIAVDNQNVKVK
jgi:hypothetical protein